MQTDIYNMRAAHVIFTIWFCLTAFLLATPRGARAEVAADIMFVTQVPIPADFTTIGSVFGNHLGSLESCGRGGDLYIRYSDGTLKNLTAAAGYGNAGLQGAGSIAVRNPSVHWNGTKALFSMVRGAPSQYQTTRYVWQIYEITGLGKNDSPVITKITNQPTDYNNVMPIYGTDERIIFISDRPRNGQAHLYPQRDEYESAPTNTGVWSLDPTSGDLILLEHAPSGDFNPTIDSYGRVIFSRWDHLQRDQQSDGDNMDYGGFNYSDESSSANRIDSRAEVFPEPRSSDEAVAGIELHSFNHFFPWMINEDGTEAETLNHIGRHELHSYFNRSFNNDSNLEEFIVSESGDINQNRIQNLLMIREDPAHPGNYFGIDAPEFRTHSSGQIVSLNGPPGLAADQMRVTYITHPDTASYTDTPDADHSGLYRNPLPMANGALVASHTTSTQDDENEGSRTSPQSRYAFRIKSLKKVGNYWIPDQALTSGISKSISYYDPDQLVSYSGALWELDPVEVRVREKPARRSPSLETPESSIFSEEGISLEEFRAYLEDNNLALIVSRNVTSRDEADLQQPFNLRIPNSTTSTIGKSGTVYDVTSLQLFQGDQVRGYGGVSSPSAGRRVLAQILHDTATINPPNEAGPSGSVRLGFDGSMAAFVPARRAMTWQLTNDAGDAVVRERYWLTFQRGEIRLCTSCHGLNSKDQAGGTTPVNQPEALRDLLRYWKNLPQGGSPGYRLKVQGKNLRGKLGGTLYPKRQLLVSVNSTNSSAAEKALELRLSINGTSCDSAIASFNTDSEGNYSLKKKTPATKASLKLKFDLVYRSQILATARSKVVGSKLRTKLSAKALKSLCQKF